MTRVLVIGGTGFLGTHLVRLLQAAEYDVRVLSRAAGTMRRPDLGRVEYVQGSVAQEDEVLRAVEGVSVVYDLSLGACSTREEMERDYILGTMNVVKAVFQFGVRRLIYASTTSVLDLGRRGMVTEANGVDPRALERRGFYHKGKLAAETLLFQEHRRKGLPVVVLRPGIIMGAGGKLNHAAIGAWRSDTCALVIGKGTNPLPFVLVEDAAEALLLAMKTPNIEGRAFNIVGDVRPSAQDIVRAMREMSRRNFRIYKQGHFQFFVLSHAKWCLKKVIGKPAGERPSYHEACFERLLANVDNSVAKEVLGWRPQQDCKVFLDRAIGPHVRPVLHGDLRLD